MTTDLTRRHAIILGLSAGINGSVFAQDIAVKISPSSDLKISKYLQQYLVTPRVAGQGAYSLWGFDIYHATLWRGEKSLSPEQWHTQRLALELRYARDFKGKDIAKRSIDEMHMQNPLPQEKAQSWLQILEAVFPDVCKDQTLTGIYLPTENSQFIFNDKLVGSIKDADLAERFFAIWLSPKTSAQKLRKQLFGDAPSLAG